MGKPTATVRPQTAGASPFSTKVGTDCITMGPWTPELNSSYRNDLLCAVVKFRVKDDMTDENNNGSFTLAEDDSETMKFQVSVNIYKQPFTSRSQCWTRSRLVCTYHCKLAFMEARSR